MTSDQIRNALKAVPFKPFVLKATGGREYVVPHPEFALLSPSGRTMSVVATDDSFAVLDVLMVESINFTPNGRTRRRRST